jgi:hypothetical protein
MLCVQVEGCYDSRYLVRHLCDSGQAELWYYTELNHAVHPYTMTQPQYTEWGVTSSGIRLLLLYLEHAAVCCHLKYFQHERRKVKTSEKHEDRKC